MNVNELQDLDDDGCFDCDSGYGPFASFDVADWKQIEEQFKSTQVILEERAGKTITRLKKPRDLYALSTHSGAQHSVRWPAEVQVLPFRPRHYIGQGKFKEPWHFQEPVSAPPRSSDIFGKVVYDNSPDPAVKYFMRSRVGGKSISIQPYYSLQGSSDKTLLFESRFESGNLMRAIKIGEYDYELWLRFDLYTKKNTQWYYFRVQNARPGIQYRFTIMNFMKSGSLYNDGMRPLMYSEHGSKTRGQGWIRVGTNIRYYRNDIRVEEGKDRYYYSLTWTCTFPYENDTCYLAHCFPYTYSDLQEYLTSISQHPEKSKFCKQRVLCRTLAGNHVYALTITSPTRRPEEAEIKQAVVVTARVHPGETNASWMMKGFLDYITGEAPDAKVLRDHFIFKVVPMLNPDGVIVGNYRCSLTGRDLNRNYKTVLKDSFPPVWHTRHMVRRLQEERSIILYCDFHGHSRKQNVFIYGCGGKKHAHNILEDRVFPYMLARNAPDKFSFDGCRFKVHKNKEGTGRVVMWNLGIKNSYTMEATFCGSSLGAQKGYHFSTADFQAMGYHFCDTLLDFCDPDPSKVSFAYHELESRITSAFVKQMEREGKVVPEASFEQSIAFISDLESDSVGSDSSVSDGLPMQLLYATVPELSRKKRLKTRKERNKRLKSFAMKESQANTSDPTNKVLQNKVAHEQKSGRKANEIHSFSSKSRFGYSSGRKSSNKEQSQIPSNVKLRLDAKAQSRAEYLDFITKAYTAHNKIEECSSRQGSPSLKYSRGKSPRSHRSNSTCEICNAVYGSSRCSDVSDDDDDAILNPLMRTCEPLQDVLMSHLPHEARNNFALELAKQITLYNSRTKPVAPKKLGKISMHSTLAKYNYQELLKRRTLSQGDNLEYIRKELENISTTKASQIMREGAYPQQSQMSSMNPTSKVGKSQMRISIAECRVAESADGKGTSVFKNANDREASSDSPRTITNYQVDQAAKKRLPTLRRLHISEGMPPSRKTECSPVSDSALLSTMHLQRSQKLFSTESAAKEEGLREPDRLYQGTLIPGNKDAYATTSVQRRCPERRSFHVASCKEQSYENLQDAPGNAADVSSDATGRPSLRSTLSTGSRVGSRYRAAGRLRIVEGKPPRGGQQKE